MNHLIATFTDQKISSEEESIFRQFSRNISFYIQKTQTEYFALSYELLRPIQYFAYLDIKRETQI